MTNVGNNSTHAQVGKFKINMFLMCVHLMANTNKTKINGKTQR